MATQRPSAAFRTVLCEKILARIEQLQLEKAQAAERLGISVTQMSRLVDGQDIFSNDRLVDAEVRIELEVRMTATRPYRER